MFGKDVNAVKGKTPERVSSVLAMSRHLLKMLACFKSQIVLCDLIDSVLLVHALVQGKFPIAGDGPRSPGEGAQRQHARHRW